MDLDVLEFRPSAPETDFMHYVPHFCHLVGESKDLAEVETDGFHGSTSHCDGSGPTLGDRIQTENDENFSEETNNTG